MNLSFLVTSHNEKESLDKLLERLVLCKEVGDEIIVLDDFSTDPVTLDIFKKYSDNIFLYRHSLNRDYSAHKNAGGEHCKNPWIFQLDGDELPTELLLVNLKDIIASNPGIELFCVPRINIFTGYDPKNPAHTAYGWTMTHSPTFNCLRANFPDAQGRIYKNDPKRIRWNLRLHEKLEGHNGFVFLPSDNEDLSLHHVKTIEQQLKTNKRYNELFTLEENLGHHGHQ